MFKNNLGIILLASLMLQGCGEQPKEAKVVRPVYAIQVEKSSGFPRRSFPGKAKAVEQANLAFGVDGTLDKLPINVGDEVKKNHLIAQLNQRDFISKVNSTKSQLGRNQKNLVRADELVKKDFISKSEHDRMTTAVEVSQASLELAQKALEDATIRAPFDGVITDKFVENFESVRAKQIIARILDISEIEMIVQIPENLISRIKLVKTIEVVFDSYPDIKFTATIKEVGREASKTTRTFPITLIMPQGKKNKILPGMAGNARVKEVKGQGQDEKILIPVGAIFTPNNQKQDHVWLVKNGKVSLKKIEVLNLTTQGAFIKSGLAVGDTVVIAGVHSLKDGQSVKVISQLESR